MQRVLREAMEAGAAGFATSFASPHRGIDGKPVPSRFADRAEFEALLDDDGRGRPWRRVDRAGRAVPAGRHVRPPAEGRGAVHVGRAAHLTGSRPQGVAGGQRRRVGARRRGVAAGDAAPAHLHVHPRLAVPARGERVLRRVAERQRHRAHRGLRRPRVADEDEGCARFGAAASASAGTPTRSGRARRTRRSSTASWPTSPPSAARSRSTASSTSPSTSPVSSCACARSSPTTTRPVSPTSSSTSTARSVSPTPAPTPASCATRRRPPTCWATGCATVGSCRWSRRSASSAASRPTCSASRTAATCVRVRSPTSRCSTPPPWRPVRSAGCSDFPAGAERLTADAPVGMQHVVVNGTPIRVDGESTDAGNVGQVVKPSARP